MDLSSISKVTDFDHIRETFFMVADLVLSTSSKSLFTSDLTSSFTVTAEVGKSDTSMEPSIQVVGQGRGGEFQKKIRKIRKTKYHNL